MEVFINGISQVGAGQRTYFNNILPTLAKAYPNDSFWVAVPSRDNGIIPEVLYDYDNIEPIWVDVSPRELASRLWTEQVRLPTIVNQIDPAVVYLPAGIRLFAVRRPVVVAITNPNPFMQASGRVDHTLASRIKNVGRRWLARISARRSERVMFVSEYSRKRIAPYINVPRSKQRVIYHGLDRSMFVDPDYDLMCIDERLPELEEYLVSVSTINPHKNYETLIRAYSLLADDEDVPRLVVAGRFTSEEYEKKIRVLVTEHNLEKKIVFLGEVEHEKIPTLLHHAEVMVFPSYLETFGHPLVESMAAGTPVVASRSTCIPEITSGAAALFEPTSARSLAEVIKEVISDEEYGQLLRQRGYDRAADFSWDQTAAELMEVLREAVADAN